MMAEDEVRIRPAHAEDGPALLDLTERVDAVSPYLSREPGEPPVWFHGEAERDLGAFLARGNCAAFLAVTPQNRMAGFLTLAGGHWRRNRGVATVSVALLPECQGRGLGGTLFAAAHAWADNTGLHRLELTAVEANEAARRLYRRIGYVEEGRTRASLIRGGAVHDEVVMARVMLPDTAPRWPDLTLPALPPPDTGGVQVRPAAARDAAALFAFDRAVRAESPFLLRSAAEAFRDPGAAAAYLARFDGRDGVALVAGIEHEVVGLAAAQRGSLRGLAHEAELLLIVRREWWGGGLGSRLAEAAENWARGQGVRRLIVRVMGHNQRALTLFARRGFEAEARLVCDALVDGRYADHLLLAKAL